MKAKIKYNRLHKNHPNKKKAHRAFVMEVARNIRRETEMRMARKRRLRRMVNLVKFYLTDTILGVSLAGVACGMILTAIVGG